MELLFLCAALVAGVVLVYRAHKRERVMVTFAIPLSLELERLGFDPGLRSSQAALRHLRREISEFNALIEDYYRFDPGKPQPGNVMERAATKLAEHIVEVAKRHPDQQSRIGRPTLYDDTIGGFSALLESLEP